MKDKTIYSVTTPNSDSKKLHLTTTDLATATELFNDNKSNYFDLQLKAHRTRITEWRIL